jgi:hypothetical protein
LGWQARDRPVACSFVAEHTVKDALRACLGSGHPGPGLTSADF